MADLSSASSQPASSSQAQQVRIQFPERFLTTRSTHGHPSRPSSINFTRPAQQSQSENRLSATLGEGRRRVHSLGPDPLVSASQPSKNTPRHYGSRRKKNPTQSQNSATPPLKPGSFTTDFEPNVFSDEYDLYPKILQDVQRALHLQSRRRERMSQQHYLTSDDVPCSSDVRTNLSTAHASTSTAPLASHSSPQYLQVQVANLASEVDFSPSTRSVPPHPVPLSSNGGATLDWTGSQSEEERLERRWSISRGKRKAKEKFIPSSKTVVEKQETLFTDRIARIKAEASPPTIRKAAIVNEQLGRRYNILYSSLANGDRVDLAQVARWHAGLGAEAQAWLASAEPLTWLKHLLNRRGKRRSEWHVSALIVEEYMKNKKGISSTPPPQSSIASSSLETPSFHYHLPTTTRRPSDSSPATSLSQVRSSDGHISFGPRVANSHDTFNTPSMHGEGKTRRWRHSFPAIFDSARVIGTPPSPSPYQIRGSTGGLSPASSRLNFPIVHRLRRHPAESEEGSSSPINSQSEDQNDSLRSGPHKKSKQRDPFHLGELQSPLETALEIDASDGVLDVNVDPPLQADSIAVPALPRHSDTEIDLPPTGGHPDTTLAPSGPLSSKRPHRSASLPLTSDAYPTLAESKGKPEEDDQFERDYEMKSRTLEELKNYNHRLRHRMQRVAVDVREYDLVCSTVMQELGISYRTLPTDLLDTLGHDPSAVTGGTRKRHGWKVVEDIHARVLRQRRTLTSFLSEARTHADTVSVRENVLDKPISTLIEMLQALESERGPLQRQADEVARILTEVKASHLAVKEEYNDALSHTSVVYPELSHIVALEESYKDQYQQVWELGMDALTLILDTITPFWRSYGKIIGEDMQDFIIIPWYRNEFTGEPKRYPVQLVPRRSLRHWVALVSLFFLTFFVTFLQGRAAVTSAWHYRLLWIDNQAFRLAIMPFFWVIILIQWLALMFEVCVVLLYIAVVVWWLGWLVGILT